MLARSVRTLTARVGLAWALLLLVGCAGGVLGPAPEPEPIYVPEYAQALPNGSIYQPQRGVIPLFEDRRPRRVGDILTIVLNEQVSASKSAQSNATRSGSSTLTLDQLPDVLEELAEYGFDLSAESEFTGGGGARANNTLNGTISVSVTGVEPNGNLQVRGEKRITINQGTEYIRFYGIVNPRTISGRNSVPSTEVASARIEYTGDGYINAAQRMGWLQRFFLSVSPI